ncbi:Transcription factor unc-3 [Thelohanellus kitauei]|uniref:Transcription factor unc-3 n=1 Tax=Thelohanellus kitauei TaxID=669202 RepID=A0A0C2NAX8_THEKT|nr:Transcription factor unc-3 [Thelohanellus kitauei]
MSQDVGETSQAEGVSNSRTRDDKSRSKYKNSTKEQKEEELDIAFSVFKKQPPDNLRKSNFFHFDLVFYDTNKGEVKVDKAIFSGFLEDEPGEKKLRNGIIYQLSFEFQNGISPFRQGKKQTEKILVRLIDSSSKKAISYEGQDKNPDMCRVLLTHEVMCRYGLLSNQVDVVTINHVETETRLHQILRF